MEYLIIILITRNDKDCPALQYKTINHVWQQDLSHMQAIRVYTGNRVRESLEIYVKYINLGSKTFRGIWGKSIRPLTTQLRKTML